MAPNLTDRSSSPLTAFALAGGARQLIVDIKRFSGMVELHGIPPAAQVARELGVSRRMA